NMSCRRGSVLSQADVILALEMNDLWGVLNQFSDRIVRSYRQVFKKDAKVVTLGSRDPYDARGKKLAAARLAVFEQAKSDATLGWDASPITTARMCAEVYAQIKDEDWSLVGNAIRNVWPLRLWDIKESYQWNGGSRRAPPGYHPPPPPP